MHHAGRFRTLCLTCLHWRDVPVSVRHTLPRGTIATGTSLRANTWHDIHPRCWRGWDTTLRTPAVDCYRLTPAGAHRAGLRDVGQRAVPCGCETPHTCTRTFFCIHAIVPPPLSLTFIHTYNTFQDQTGTLLGKHCTFAFIPLLFPSLL